MRSGVGRASNPTGPTSQRAIGPDQLFSETRVLPADEGVVKKVIPLVVAENELIELHRLLIDDDAAAALEWIRRHLGGKILRLLEGG
jgi:hypothetical protein